MKKGIKITLIVLLALILAVAGLCWWQWDNITALKMSLDHSREDLSQMMEQNNQRVDDVSNKLPVSVRDLTEEEKAALRDESLSREEILDRLTGKDTPSAEPSPEASEEPAESQPATSEQPEATPSAQPSQSPQPPQSAQPEPSKEPEQEEGTNEDKLSRYIAEIYLMKTEYTTWLEEAYAACIEEYVALPEKERTSAAKYNLGMKYMRSALAKEDECDLRMADIQGKILALLQEMGEDTSLVDEIQAAYEEEKALKKAYYLGLHS